MTHDYLSFATNPLSTANYSLSEMKRQLFNPTKSEIAEWNVKQRRNAKNIRTAIARLECEGKW